jgi:hypothetical protein
MKSVVIYIPGAQPIFVKKGLEVTKGGTEEKTTIKGFTVKGQTVVVRYENKDKVEFRGLPISIEY